MNDEAIYAVLLGLMVIGAIWAWMRPHLPRILERWTHEHGYTLLGFDVPRFYEGPSGWRRNENFKSEYHVIVQDAGGRTRSGWLVYEDKWSLGLQKFKEVIWEGDWAKRGQNE